MSSAEPQPPDQTLLHRALKGDVAAFGALVERHFGPVYAVALARLREPESAEDLAQEVFLRAQIHLQRLGPSGNFAGWVVRIARNLAIDWQRRKQTASRLLPLVALGERAGEIPDTSTRGAREAMASDEEHSAVRRAIRDLPDDLREVVLLHWTEALTQQEIANRLGLNQATVSRRLQRALKALRGTLEPVLREAAPAFRPAPRALAKSLAITVAVGALSGTAKAALVTAAPISQISSATQAAQMGAVGTAGVIGFIKSLPALVAGGAKVMATGKGIAATVAAVGAVSVGTYHLTHTDSDSGAVSGRTDTPLPSFTNSLGMRMVQIPGGTFEMGLSDAEMRALATLQFAQEGVPDRDLAEQWIERGLPFEEMARAIGATPTPSQTLLDLTAFVTNRSDRPSHHVTLDAFHMSETEVTVEQYLRFVEASGHRAPPDNRYKPHAEYPNTPITNVTWNDAMAFCVWLSETEEGTYCLPTEAEWEYACRAGTTMLFAFGDTLDPEAAHFSHEIHGAGPLDVGSFLPNAWGLRDMHGNVSEWCLDLFSEDFYSNPRATARNPVSNQPERGLPSHSLRGGGWVDVSDIYPSGLLHHSSFRGPGFAPDF
ncbi:sigma-70 family RNA polymerase sigma factor, partial [Candidatus Sumerlaeota bacterium]|nr:sigma-70 family RNA polymerase sigma factor [Candidatus Sumerlaeota bacterium]